jgi:4-amino-4-deoxy-L-arabinose transferase-like glycosyltransferase
LAEAGLKRLAPALTRCHGAAMAADPKAPRAGGALLALAILTGVGVGVYARQPSIGFLAGAGIGLLLLLLVWLHDRRR